MLLVYHLPFAAVVQASSYPPFRIYNSSCHSEAVAVKWKRHLKVKFIIKIPDLCVIRSVVVLYAKVMQCAAETNKKSQKQKNSNGFKEESLQCPLNSLYHEMVVLLLSFKFIEFSGII